MKQLIIAAFALLTLGASAQTANVSPSISGSNIVITVQDSSGGSHLISIPFTYTFTVSGGTDTYTPPAAPPPPPPSGAPVIPSTATAVNLLPQTWKTCVHDAGTPGTGTCSSGYPVTDPVTGSSTAYSFAMSYTGAGGVRWADSFAKDTAATNYVLDTTVISSDWTHTANLELDTNQTKANGDTAILGTQCSSYGHSWEVTLMNSSGSWSWYTTNLACNPLTWTPNVPHHIRIFGTIDASEVSTYIGVEFDGTYAAFTNATGKTGRALGWSVGSNLTNVQIDGLGASGSATIFADQLVEYRW